MGRVSEMAMQMGAITARARRTDPPTSHDAAARKIGRVSTHGAKIRLALMEMMSEGGTCHEIAAKCGLHYVQVARMMKALESRNYVLRSGRERLGPNGDYCIVWIGK
jgi:hypothetical protein